jgi:hypothetical protein
MAPPNGADAKETIMKRVDPNSSAPRHVRGITGLTLVVTLAVVAAISEPSLLHRARLDPMPAATAAADAAQAVTTSDDYLPSHYPAPTERAEPMPTF